MTGASNPILYPETAFMGYRDKTNYEPFGDPASYNTRPVRPYNATQWAGVALGSLGILMALLHFGNELGWFALGFDLGVPASISAMMLGSLLVNSRREPVPDLAPELAAARRRWTLIVTLTVAALIGVAMIADAFLGAK